MLIGHCYLEGLRPSDWERFLAACGLFTGNVERGEGPEVFLDLTRLAASKEALLELKALLVPRLGRRLFTSLASNKLTARAATLAQRVGRVQRGEDPVVVPPGKEAEFLAPLPVGFLWPLGERLCRRLALLGLATIREVAALPPDELYRCFGQQGYQIALLSRGLDGSQVRGEASCYLEYRSPWAGAADGVRLTNWCLESGRYLARSQERRQVWGRRLELILFPEAGEEPVTAVREFNRPALTVEELQFALLRLLPSVLPQRLSSLSVRLGPLVPQVGEQLSLLSPFSPPPRERQRLLGVLSRLQERYPGCVDWGSNLPVNRREQVLAFYDPLRRMAVTTGTTTEAKVGQKRAAG
ncbi:MAG: hypothetical protein ACOX2S_08155 [bacterium]